MSRTVVLLTAAAGAVSAGALLPFSTFTMHALHDLRPIEAVRAMRAINTHAPHGIFVTLLVGSAVGGVVVAGQALAQRDPGWLLRCCGGVAVTAAFVVTATINVPLNDRLAHASITEASAPAVWRDYARPWTAANTARVLLGLAGSVALAVSAVAGDSPRS